MSQARSFAALRQPRFRLFFLGVASVMMADAIEHVISYWVLFQKFQSPVLAGFAIVSHWLPFLLLAPAIFSIARRFPLEPGNWRRSFGVHVIGSLAVCVAYAGCRCVAV